MWSLKGLGVVIVIAAILAVPLYKYWEFLTQGMRPPKSTLILNELEKNGVPDFTLPDLQDRPVALKDFKGKVTLVNIWATWCAPCIKEFPSLKGLVEHFKGDLVVLAISQDKDKEDIISFVRAFGDLPEGFVIVWDKDKSMNQIFHTQALPETYILSTEHKLLRKIAGETIWDDKMAISFFNTLINGTNISPHAPMGSENPHVKTPEKSEGIKTH